MISKPPALLVSWPQRLRADQKVKRACCESRAPQIALCSPSWHPRWSDPVWGVLCCVHGIGHKANVVYRQLHWLAGSACADLKGAEA
jgi:hypothetical protein